MSDTESDIQSNESDIESDIKDTNHGFTILGMSEKCEICVSKKAIIDSIKFSSSDDFLRLYKNPCHVHHEFYINIAIIHERLDILQILLSSEYGKCFSDYVIVESALRSGTPKVLKLLSENYSSYINIDTAAAEGNLDLVIWITTNIPDAECTNRAMDYAAMYGNFEIVKWLHENRTEGCTTRAIDDSAEYDDSIDIIKFLHQNRKEGCTTKAMDEAASHGNLDIVIFLHENRTEGCTTKAMNCAAAHGHLHVVIWLHENRKEGCTTNAMDWAAKGGHFAVVKWLHENRTEGCTADAKRTMYPEISEWLCKNRKECL